MYLSHNITTRLVTPWDKLYNFDFSAWISGTGSFASSRYVHFKNEVQNWYDGNSSCARIGAHLIKIESDEENEFVKKNFLTSGNLMMVWIGLSDIAVEGRWIWTDGTELQSSGFNNWGKHQPSNHNNQDCVATIHGYSAGRIWIAEWNDYGCLHTIGYICER